VPSDKDTKLHFTVPVAHGKQRFREMIIYISKKSEDDPHFGAVKLNKILYYADFRAYERLGQPITGMVYFRLEKGPAPKALLSVRQELKQEGALRIDRVPVGPYIQDRTVALREPIITLFTEDELQIVDRVIEELWDQNAVEVSDASHDVRWRTLLDRDPLPYEFAFLDNSELTKDDLSRGRELAEQLKWPLGK
jgi:Protein of unknown function (DUF4065)